MKRPRVVGGGSVPSINPISPDGTQIDTLNSLAGNVQNGFGTWTFGPARVLPTAVGPPGPFGNFNFVKLNGKIITDNSIPWAQAIRIDYSGKVFFLTTGNDRWWFEYVGYNASAFFVGDPNIVPGSVVTSPAPPTTFTPPYTPSPDGTSISGGTGTLTTAEGPWTFSGAGPGYAIMLNGIPITVSIPGGATQMRVATQGRLFALALNNSHWYAFLNFEWYDVGTSVPPGPIPVEVDFSICMRSDLTSSSPNGTVVSTITTVMSDGSPFSGTFNFTGGGGELGLTGSGATRNVVINSPLAASSATGYAISITQGGVTINAGSATLGVWVFS